MKRKNNHLMIIYLSIMYFDLYYFINYLIFIIIYQQLSMLYMMDLGSIHSFIVFIINIGINRIIDH
jgi:hypothetical protein